jgi:hypothetical protein
LVTSCARAGAVVSQALAINPAAIRKFDFMGSLLTAMLHYVTNRPQKARLRKWAAAKL